MLKYSEVNDLVFTWHKKLDLHAQFEDVKPMLISESLEMKFSEDTLTSIAEFENWYKTVTNRFFNEIHSLQLVNIDLDGNTANVKVAVNWQAHTWEPPEAKSKWLGFDAYQTWIVKRDPVTEKAVIAILTVDRLEPMEGSSSL